MPYPKDKFPTREAIFDECIKDYKTTRKAGKHANKLPFADIVLGLIKWTNKAALSYGLNKKISRRRKIAKIYDFK